VRAAAPAAGAREATQLPERSSTSADDDDVGHNAWFDVDAALGITSAAAHAAPQPHGTQHHSDGAVAPGMLSRQLVRVEHLEVSSAEEEAQTQPSVSRAARRIAARVLRDPLVVILARPGGLLTRERPPGPAPALRLLQQRLHDAQQLPSAGLRNVVLDGALWPCLPPAQRAAFLTAALTHAAERSNVVCAAGHRGPWIGAVRFRRHVAPRIPWHEPRVPVCLPRSDAMPRPWLQATRLAGVQLEPLPVQVQGPPVLAAALAPACCHSKAGGDE
jgi:hypothetical protein